MQVVKRRWGAAADSIARLVCCYSPPLRERKIIVVLDGYVDDSGASGDQRDGDHFMLAGYVACAESWMRFSEEWDIECAKEPPTPDFKMSKAMRPVDSGDDDGYVWTEAQRDLRIGNLAAIVNRWTLLRVSCATRKSGYENIIKGNVPRQIDSIFFMPFFTVITAVAHYMTQYGLAGTVDWVFDDMSKAGLRARKHYEWIKEHADPFIKARLGAEPIFRNDSQVLPLKAADMLAWSLRRHHSVEQPAGAAVGPILERLLSEKYGVMTKIEGHHMDQFVRGIRHNTLAVVADMQSHYPKEGSFPASAACH